MFSPLGSPLRLSLEAEQDRREEILLEIARKAARAGGAGVEPAPNPDALDSESLARLITQAREDLSMFGLAELEAALLIMR